MAAFWLPGREHLQDTMGTHRIQNYQANEREKELEKVCVTEGEREQELIWEKAESVEPCDLIKRVVCIISTLHSGRMGSRKMQSKINARLLGKM